MQEVFEIEALPESGLAASAAFYRHYLDRAQTLLSRESLTSLAIVLPAAGQDEDDWRRSLARDLARAHRPARVNVIGADGAASKASMLAYLRDAPGVTGQYLAAHD
jgi:hypothetical protein